MNIILTKLCHNNCQYCFARNTNQSEHITIEEFQFILNFLQRSNFNRIRLLGGEPMLHPQIEEILQISMKTDFFSEIKLFTSGRFPKELFGFLIMARPKLKVIFNLKEESDYSSTDYTEILQSLQTFIDHGIKTSLSYTIYKTDFNPSGHLQALKRFGIPTLRWALASPTPSGDNKYLTIKKDTKWGNKIGEFLLECAHFGIETRLDCVIPLCIFTPEMRGRIEWANPGFGHHHIPGICSAAIDVGHGLIVWRCFGLRGIEASLRDFENLNALQHYLKRYDYELQWMKMSKDCDGCEAAEKHYCQGGCLALRQINETNNEVLNILSPENRDNDTATFPEKICNQLFRIASRGEHDIFLHKWTQIRTLPIVSCYPGKVILDACAADLKGEATLALQYWRRVLPLLKEEKREYALKRISELNDKLQEIIL